MLEVFIGMIKNMINGIKEKQRLEKEQEATNSLKKAMGNRFLHLPK
jgi:hypothetical protein